MTIILDNVSEKEPGMKKMILAAVNAKYIHSNLAVYSLKTYCQKKQGIGIGLKEYTINQQKEEIMRDLYGENPDVLAFSCYIWNISIVKELLCELSKVLPHTCFWVGGPEVSYDARQFLEENPWVTGVMKGEGEETFSCLAGYYLKGEGELEGIEGITFRKDGEILENPWREPLDLDTVPFVYEQLQEFQNRILYYESSRGCPFSCSYCLSSVDKKLRFRSPERVKEELQFFLDRQVPQVKFVDRTFNCKKAHALEIWKYLAEHDNGITNFHFEISADLLTDEEIQLMKKMRPGLIQLEIGVQSVNEDTLKAIGRKMDFSRVKERVRQVKEGGNIHQHLDLIAGLPWEDLESFHRSFEEVYALEPEQLQLGFLKVLKGSRMYEEAKNCGCVYQEKEPYEVLFTRWISYGDLLQLKTVESMVEIYYNSCQFVNTLKTILPWFTDAFTFYLELGNYYEEQGYLLLSHSRLRRYEILREFLKKQKQIPLKEAEEAMLLDLYLRERLKSRPAWAPERGSYEKKLNRLRKERQIPKTAHIEVFEPGRILLFDYENRDPLTKNARVEELDWNLDEE